MCSIEDYKDLHLCYVHRPLVEQELRIWHEHYLPIGKRHLDGGAGCGETVKFFLSHGAEKVLAIECNPECLENLRYNFGKDERVTIVDFMVDTMKWDIEGAERNMKIEVHFPFKIRRLAGWPGAPTTLNVLTEDWGGPVTKAKRKLGTWLIQ